MTSQTLINERAAQFSTTAVSDSTSTNASSNVTSSKVSKELPYRATHQVELLHLQAETEALLQEIQTVKQQRVNLVL